MKGVSGDYGDAGAVGGGGLLTRVTFLAGVILGMVLMAWLARK